MASALRTRIQMQSVRQGKISEQMKKRDKKDEKPISEEEHKKRLELLKSIDVLK